MECQDKSFHASLSYCFNFDVATGQVFNQAVEDKQDVTATLEQENKDLYDNSYMGYAMVTAQFNDDNVLGGLTMVYNPL